MVLFFKTLFAGIKEGAIAAWYDLRWYLLFMAIVFVAFKVYILLKAKKH